MSDALLITADRVWTGETTRAGAGVLIDRGRVAEVGTGLRAEHRIHVPGATILPGLIDGHVHLSFTPGRDPALAIPAADDVDLLTLMTGHAQRMLARGVTTVRDLGDRGGLAVRLRDAIARGDLDGPRILAAGPPVTPRRGHCWFLGGEIGDEPGDPARLVARLAALGVDWVKVMVSGGNSTAGGAAPWEPQFSGRVLAEIVAAARSHGLPVAAHAHGAASVATSAEAGVDTIEHCTLLDPTGTGVSFDPAVAARIVEAGAWVCHADGYDVARYEQILPADVAAALGRRTRWLADQGVRLLAGTDSGVSAFSPLVRSLENQTDAFDAVTLLRSATADAAIALRVADRTGRLAPGLDADVLVVRGDPTSDLAALHDVALVVRAGRVVHADPGLTSSDSGIRSDTRR